MIYGKLHNKQLCTILKFQQKNLKKKLRKTNNVNRNITGAGI